MVHCAHRGARLAGRGILWLDIGSDGTGYCELSPVQQPRCKDHKLTFQVNLQVLSQAGTPEEQIQAPKVLKLIQKGRHTMLVVLLLGERCSALPWDHALAHLEGNTLVNTSLPIFLDSIVRTISVLAGFCGSGLS